MSFTKLITNSLILMIWFLIFTVSRISSSTRANRRRSQLQPSISTLLINLIIIVRVEIEKTDSRLTVLQRRRCYRRGRWLGCFRCCCGLVRRRCCSCYWRSGGRWGRRRLSGGCGSFYFGQAIFRLGSHSRERRRRRWVALFLG